MKNRISNTKKMNVMIPDWYLDDNGILYVSGEGKMKDYSANDERTLPPWSPIKNQIRIICFGEGITELGGHAFEGCGNLEKVILPATLSKIHHSCFKDCVKLKTVIVSDEKEFYHASEDEVRMAKREVASRRRGGKLGDIFFGTNAFYDVPWAVNKWGNLYINNHALYACFHAQGQISIPEGVEVICPFVFEGMEVETVRFPSSLKEIHKFALADTKITRVVLPERLEKIEEFAFSGSPLEMALVPYASEKTIPWKVFNDTKIIYTFARRFIKRYPEAYRLVSVPKYQTSIPEADEFSKIEYKKLYIEEREPEVSELDKSSIGTVATNSLNAGQSILRRLYRDMLVIHITYNEQDKTVQELKSYRYYRNLDWSEEPVIYEMNLNPCYRTVDGTSHVSVGEVTFQAMSKEELRETYFIRNMPEELVHTGNLRVYGNGIKEEWYCVKGLYTMKTIQEEEFLNLWLEAHPDYIIRKQ